MHKITCKDFEIIMLNIRSQTKNIYLKPQKMEKMEKMEKWKKNQLWEKTDQWLPEKRRWDRAYYNGTQEICGGNGNVHCLDCGDECINL